MFGCIGYDEVVFNLRMMYPLEITTSIKTERLLKYFAPYKIVAIILWERVAIICIADIDIMLYHM